MQTKLITQKMNIGILHEYLVRMLGLMKEMSSWVRQWDSKVQTEIADLNVLAQTETI